MRQKYSVKDGLDGMITEREILLTASVCFEPGINMKLDDAACFSTSASHKRKCEFDCEDRRAVSAERPPHPELASQGELGVSLSYLVGVRGSGSAIASRKATARSRRVSS